MPTWQRWPIVIISGLGTSYVVEVIVGRPVRGSVFGGFILGLLAVELLVRHRASRLAES